MRWLEETFSEEVADRLASNLSISSILSRFLVARGLTDPDASRTFLKPKLAELDDPFNLPAMAQAVDRLVQALETKEQVLLVGDYDVDGITSTVILKRVMTILGNKPNHVTPKRKEEGYGLTVGVIERGFKQSIPSLVVALDCGTNSKEEYSYLKEKQIDLLVVDHHQAKESLPEGPILLNPHLHEDLGEPWRHLCTAGLTFKLIHGLIKRLRQSGNETALNLTPKTFLALAAMGTIADLVPLRDENRIIARFGLKHLSHDPNPGLDALMSISGVNKGETLGGEDVNFRLAPRINACGRLNKPEVAAQLLLNENPEECKRLANQLDDFNKERRRIEAQLTEEAETKAKEKFSEQPAVVACGHGEHWNPGVVGIVAGKLAGDLGKPCIVLAEDGDACKGSGRSIPGVNILEALSRCKELLTHWGGHPAAVGLGMPKNNLAAFQDAFVGAILDQIGNEIPEKTLRIDATISTEDLRAELLHEIADLAPFGQENPEPVLALKGVNLAGPPRKVGNGNHFQFSVFNGEEVIFGIAWNMGESIPPVSRAVDLAFRFRWNSWNGKRMPQMVLVDWRIAH